MSSTIWKRLENFLRLPLARIFLAIVIIIVILLMAEMFPRYISLPIHSPDYATGNKFDDWNLYNTFCFRYTSWVS